MDAKKILVGTIIWSLGILVPVLHHVLLIYAAIREEGYRYSYSNMVKYFYGLPWIVWLYLVAMLTVGAIVVIAGLRPGPSKD